MADMQEVEAEFFISENPGRDAKPQACRECHKESAINPGGMTGSPLALDDQRRDGDG